MVRKYNLGQANCADCVKKKQAISFNISQTVIDHKKQISLLTKSPSTSIEMDQIFIRNDKYKGSVKFRPVLDLTNLDKSNECEKTKLFENKVISLFSPKPKANFNFRSANKHPIEKLHSNIEVIFGNSKNISIQLPIIYEASKNDKKILESNIFIKGNYLILFLDIGNEMLYGILMSSNSNINTIKFFKITNNEPSKIEYYMETLSGMQYNRDKNSIKLQKYFGFNFNTFLLICDNKNLKSFLSYKNDMDTIYLYNNINNIKIYDMC